MLSASNELCAVELKQLRDNIALLLDKEHKYDLMGRSRKTACAASCS